MRIYNKGIFYWNWRIHIIYCCICNHVYNPNNRYKIYCSQCDCFYSWYCEYFEKSFKIRYGRRYYRRK